MPQYDVFAAGDVAMFPHKIFAKLVRVEPEDNALKMGIQAGRNERKGFSLAHKFVQGNVVTEDGLRISQLYLGYDSLPDRFSPWRN